MTPSSREVSPRSVSRSVARTMMSSIALEVIFGSLVLPGPPTVIQTTLTDGVTTWEVRVEIVCVMLLLLLHPCIAYSRALRLIPRLVVAIAIVLALILLQIDDGMGVITRPWSQTVAFVIFLATMGTFAVGVFLSTTRSAWWGRFGNVFQTPATMGILPSVMITAGLIDVMR